MPTTVIRQVEAVELAYVEFNASVSITATVEATPNDVVSAGAFTFDGATRICIEFEATEMETGTTAGSFVLLNLWDDTTDLGRFAIVENSATGLVGVSVHRRRFLTPTAGNHTYKVRGWRVNSDGSVSAGAGGVGLTLPGYIRITVA
jgi:hypothetical protein